MDEKTMVADTLSAINAELTTIGGMIPETGNPELKQLLKQMRNQTEMTQEEIYQIAKSRQYYTPAAQATPEEIQNVKSIFTQDNKTMM